MLVHASCAARDGNAVLLFGSPGAGKSDLLLRLLDAGWALVADDQVRLTADGPALLAAPPPALSGIVEARGIGLLTGLPFRAPLPVALALRLLARESVPRLPDPSHEAFAGRWLPVVPLCPWDGSAVVKVGLALDVALGRRALAAGAFAA
jgi:HPr kinase/phosphorylase